jgi:hypothetical protein
MSESKHTPGPWHINLDQIDCGDDKLSIEADEEYFIAQVDSGMYQEANARLIAAAPELLALLIESQENIGGDWRSRRDAVIAKATGEQQ